MNSFMIDPTKPATENSANTGDENKSPCNAHGLGIAIQQAGTDQAKNEGNKAIYANSNLGREASEMYDDSLQLLMSGALIGFVLGIIFFAP
jgi:hypothetical protein